MKWLEYAIILGSLAGALAGCDPSPSSDKIQALKTNAIGPNGQPVDFCFGGEGWGVGAFGAIVVPGDQAKVGPTGCDFNSGGSTTVVVQPAGSAPATVTKIK